MKKMIIVIALIFILPHQATAEINWRPIASMTNEERAFVYGVIEWASGKPAKRHLDGAAEFRISDNAVFILQKTGDGNTIFIFSAEVEQTANKKEPRHTLNNPFESNDWRSDNQSSDTRTRFEKDSAECDEAKSQYTRYVYAIERCIILLWPSEGDDEVLTRIALVDGYMEEYLTLIISEIETNEAILNMAVISDKGNRYLEKILPILPRLTSKQQNDFWEKYLWSLKALPEDQPSSDEKLVAIQRLIELFRNGATSQISITTGYKIEEIDPEGYEVLLKLRAIESGYR